MSQTLLTEIDERGVARLTLNRPELHNAFDDELISLMTAELKRLEAMTDVRVVVLQSAGRSFSAGADLNWMKRIADYSQDENYADAMALATLMSTLNQLAKPVIAKIQGAAFGGGVGLIACCDIAVCSNNASFSLSEVKLGLLPAVISPYVVSAIGERQVRRYFLTAERFNATTAKQIGLVHESVSAEVLDDTVDDIVDALLANSPAAVVAAKELAFAVSHRPVTEDVIADTARRISGIRVSTEGKEGLAAFLEKRSAAWVRP